jgi:predicted TIM-barrel fold metal-dependent hydrolase
MLRSYGNLYADLSAMSGYNAVTRDEAFGVQFLNEFQDKLFFGTDMCFADPQGRMPQLAYLRRLLAEGRISDSVFAKITSGNALKVLKRLG